MTDIAGNKAQNKPIHMSSLYDQYTSPSKVIELFYMLFSLSAHYLFFYIYFTDIARNKAKTGPHTCNCSIAGMLVHQRLWEFDYIYSLNIYFSDSVGNKTQ